jgi:hypothetical protein
MKTPARDGLGFIMRSSATSALLLLVMRFAEALLKACSIWTGGCALQVFAQFVRARLQPIASLTLVSVLTLPSLLAIRRRGSLPVSRLLANRNLTGSGQCELNLSMGRQGECAGK